MLTPAAAPPDPFSLFDLSSRRSVIAAVSGGSDSIALLLLLREHLRKSSLATRIVAATVDHGLRAASADEAKAVASLCASLGIAHRTLAWLGAKPATGIQAAAREARYGLLGEAARDAGTDIVLTGHTADDQLETVAMRAARGDGRGLAGMAPATLFRGSIWICRPLLGLRREALRDHLRTLGIGWIDDPTNADTAYERPRLREVLFAGAAETAWDAIARAGADREALGREAARLIDTHAKLDGSGALHLAPAFASAGDGASGGPGPADDRPAAIYALRLLLATMGGSEQLPDLRRSEELFAGLAKRGLRATLSRCVVESHASGILIRREMRRGAVRPLDETAVAPFARFLPCFDLAPAAALAALVGAPSFPDPPFS